MTIAHRASCLFFSLSVALVIPGLAKTLKPGSGKECDVVARAAIAAMKARANELHINGVAVVAFAPGERVEGWQSQMTVVGHMTDQKNEKGNNLLGIAYAKAAEMAETLKDSGTAGRQPMTGEFGWQGGVVARTGRGILIVAFSGGKSEDDVQVSRVGLEVMKTRL